MSNRFWKGQSYESFMGLDLNFTRLDPTSGSVILSNEPGQQVLPPTPPAFLGGVVVFPKPAERPCPQPAPGSPFRVS